MKRWVAISLGVVTLLLLCVGLWTGRQLAAIGSGLIAKQLCSLVFVTGLDAQTARKLYLQPVVGPLHGQFKHRILKEPGGITGIEVRGLTQVATAHFRQGYGCTLVHDTDKLESLTEVVTINRQVEGVDVQVRERYFDPSALEAALVRAFEEPQPSYQQSRHTLAVAVRYKGALIAERYAPGFSATTALPGWSMAKSMTTTLAGALAQQNLLAVADAALFKEWSATDKRKKITLDHLLRMTSGIDLAETGSGLDANSTMLFQQDDAAAYAMQRGIQHLPGDHWAYTGGNTTLAAHYLTQKAGGPAAMYVQIRALFDTLGMHTAVLEPDASGTFLGSSFMLASARDWSKLGQLYLEAGVWQGERLLPAGWADYVTTKTAAADPYRRYGAGFWLADDPGIYSQQNVPALPPDTFSAHGMQNQAMHIVPNEDLVVVRLGATRDYWQSGEWDLVADVIAARKQ